MIRSFVDKETERVWNGQRSRKLRQIGRVSAPHELAVPRGNRLEELKGDRKETYGIRINDQCRITFHWRDGDAHDVRIEDYHR